jgi:hypothetical protein
MKPRQPVLGFSLCANDSADASAAASMVASVAVSIEMLTRIFEGVDGAVVSTWAPR